MKWLVGKERKKDTNLVLRENNSMSMFAMGCISIVVTVFIMYVIGAFND